MPYSKGFVSNGIYGLKAPLFVRDPTELYDLHAFGMKLPHPPTAPSKIPKDVHWWERTSGGMKSSLKSPMYINPGHDPTAMILRMLRSSRVS